MEPAPDVAEGDQVGRGQVIQEEAADSQVVGRSSVRDLLQSRARELSVEASAVGVVGAACDVAERDQPVDQAGVQ